MLKASLLTLGLCAVAATTLADDYRHGDISIDHPWSRPTPPGTPVGVGYMTIHNHGEDPVTLVTGKTPVAEDVSIHETTRAGGMMRMQPLTDGLTVPPGQSVALKPQSYHLMLESLRKPLRAGEDVPLTLIFDGLEPVEVMLRVEQMDTTPESGHSSH